MVTSTDRVNNEYRAICLFRKLENRKKGRDLQLHNRTIEHPLYNMKNFTTPLELIIEQLHSRAIPSAGSGIVRQTLQFGEHGKWSH